MQINICDRISFGVAALSTGIATAATYGALQLSNQASQFCQSYLTEGLGVFEHYVSAAQKANITNACNISSQYSPYLATFGTIVAITTLYLTYRMVAPPYRK